MSPTSAEAQDPVQVEAGVKGTIGTGIIGAELGFAIPALVGLHEPWAFIVFPMVGAGAGATMGYFLIDKKENEKAAVAMLAVGIGLIVPTFILTVAMTAYRPDDAEEVDDYEGAPEDGEAVARVSPQIRERQRRARIARSGTGALRFSEEGVLVTVPGLSIGNALTQGELFRFGGEQRTEVRFALVSGVF